MFVKVTGIATNYPNSMSSVLGCCYEIEFIEYEIRYRFIMVYYIQKQTNIKESKQCSLNICCFFMFLPTQYVVDFAMLLCTAMLASINHCRLLIRWNYHLFIYLPYLIKQFLIINRDKFLPMEHPYTWASKFCRADSVVWRLYHEIMPKTQLMPAILVIPKQHHTTFSQKQ